MTDPTGMGVLGVYFCLYKFIIKATGGGGERETCLRVDRSVK